MIVHVVSVSGGKDSAAVEWRPVSGYEGIYEVSSEGNVCRVGGRILRPHKRPGKYAHVILSKIGATKTALVHRLVAAAFCERQDGLNEVNHKNGDKHDNRAENLEWCTRAENNLHAFQTLGRPPVISCKGRSGAKHPLSRMVVGANQETGEIRRYESTRLAAKDGFAQSAVAKCARAGGGLHKGWRWRYAALIEPTACSSAYGLCE